MFDASFQNILTAPLRMFIMGAAGYYFIKKEIVPEAVLAALNDLLMYLFLPCLIVYNFFTKFSFAANANWWVFPLLGIGVSFAGLVLGEIFSFAIKKKETKKQFLSLCAFQNSGYIPLLIVGAVLPTAQAEEMYTYIFLFLIGFNFLVFSLGAKLISGEKRGLVSRKDFYNPPMLATIFSLLMIFFGLNRFVPAIVMDSVKSFGDCMMGVAILVVGGSLALIKIHESTYRREIALAAVIKLLIFPALTLLILLALNIKSLTGLLLLIETAVPSAVTLTVLAKYYKKDETFINQTVFYTHLVGLVTFPIFLILYQRLLGMGS